MEPETLHPICLSLEPQLCESLRMAMQDITINWRAILATVELSVASSTGAYVLKEKTRVFKSLSLRNDIEQIISKLFDTEPLLLFIRCDTINPTSSLIAGQWCPASTSTEVRYVLGQAISFLLADQYLGLQFTEFILLKKELLYYEIMGKGMEPYLKWKYQPVQYLPTEKLIAKKAFAENQHDIEKWNDISLQSSNTLKNALEQFKLNQCNCVVMKLDNSAIHLDVETILILPKDFREKFPQKSVCIALFRLNDKIGLFLVSPRNTKRKDQLAHAIAKKSLFEDINALGIQIWTTGEVHDPHDMLETALWEPVTTGSIFQNTAPPFKPLPPR